mmetsp:Transcript_74365/g.172345  ORF Transcript_74365/g.172345 Transcript_74365/m.172345 type:complete len:157 (+) Transcript_74365:73-543(+)
MGAEASAFCSVSRPGGYLDADRKPFSCVPSGQRFESKRMQVTSADSMHGERISPWTKDLGASQGCGGCGGHGPVAAPKGYLADTQDEGAIVLDSREGALWVDDDRDSRPVDLEPGEEGGVRIPEVIARIDSAATKKDSANRFIRLGQSSPPMHRPR